MRGSYCGAVYPALGELVRGLNRRKLLQLSVTGTSKRDREALCRSVQVWRNGNQENTRTHIKP